MRNFSRAMPEYNEIPPSLTPETFPHAPVLPFVALDEEEDEATPEPDADSGSGVCLKTRSCTLAARMERLG